MSKPKIAVILGSVRPSRNGDKPAQWITRLAKEYGAFDVELVDLKDYPLPLFDAPASDLWMPTPNEVAAKWQAKLNEFDGYIIVTAEYNRSVPGALKNAIDWAYTPFIKKAVAYVSYGSVGGARAVEHLRNIMTELQAVSVRHGVHIGGSCRRSIRSPRICSTTCCGGPRPPRPPVKTRRGRPPEFPRPFLPGRVSSGQRSPGRCPFCIPGGADPPPPRTCCA
jgi:NAD(P)H-dependent FMN reductase